ncbi:molybdopterin-dependent oxidoreductase [Ottowia beijingensis]|uniref:nitrate reductase n=1 Tax=Ottowia beijingensis TaxID=1207057 RepID=UPI002FD88A5B
MTETKSTCPYCGVGCGVVIESTDGQITGVRGDPDHPANFGRLCTKGSTLHLTATPLVNATTRLLHPLRRPARGARPERIGWDAALDEISTRFHRIVQQHGADAIGVYGSGQLLTEDYYVLNKFVKGLLGTNQLDTNSRLCMSSAVAGYKATLGADAPPACYEDIAHARTLFISGSNAAWAHPILFRRIEDAKRADPALKIVVVDPRRTDTCEIADLHLPIQPGTDVLLCHGLLHVMLWEGWTDTAYIAAHTTGFDALKALVRDATPEHVARTCGIAQDELITAARWFAGVRDGGPRTPTLSLYCQGLNQSSSGTAKNAALINLHLATGQIGQPGAGPFSLTGQPNAMGGREVGAMANLLSAHRDLADPVQRAEVAALWGVDTVPEKPGLTAVEMFQAAADGALKALWIVCTNPAQSLPDQATVRRALERAEFVVVQEAFAGSETCAYANLLLPAAPWGEKDGTVTNSERRISRVRAAVPPAGEARADWRIVADVGRRLEARLRPGRATLFPYDTPGQVWNEHRASTRGRDLDITGLSYALLERAGPQHWPWPEHAGAGTPRLYADGVFATPDGKARFHAAPYAPVADPRSAHYPFSLISGRLRDQWHGMTRTGTLGRLFGHVPEPVAQMHPQDMARRGFAPGELVRIRSRQGEIVLPLAASDSLGAQQVSVPMHWGSAFVGGQAEDGQPLTGINALATPRFCPTSKQPELKHAAVRVQPAALPWRLLGMAWLAPESAAEVRAQLVALLPRFGFAACVPFGRERSGLLLRAAAVEAPTDDLLARIESLLGLATPDTLRYADRKSGQRRAARLARGQVENAPDQVTLEAFLLAGDTLAEAWIRAVLEGELPADIYGRLLLAPGAQAPVQVAARSPQICTCFNVSEAAIGECLRSCGGDESERLAQLQSQLKCGTNCGSCIPELRRLTRALQPSGMPA